MYRRWCNPDPAPDDAFEQKQSGFFGRRDLKMQVLDRLERIERDRRQSLPHQEGIGFPRVTGMTSE